MLKKTLALVLLLAFSITMQSQETQYQDRFIDHVRFGGSINMGFGSNHSFFVLAPSAIYDFSDAVSAGLSAKYMYFKNKSLITHTTNLFGGSVLTLFRPSPGIQLSAEFEQLRLSRKINIQDAVDDWQSALFVGAEYVTGNIAMGLRYDLLYDKAENLIYPSALSPVFRVYF
jgi:hypothetical protein